MRSHGSGYGSEVSRRYRLPFLLAKELTDDAPVDGAGSLEVVVVKALATDVVVLSERLLDRPAASPLAATAADESPPARTCLFLDPLPPECEDLRFVWVAWAACACARPLIL